MLWDVDGVLVSSGEAHYEAWRRLAATRGHDLSREEFLPTFGMTNPDAIRALFGEVPGPEARSMADWKEAEFRSLVRGRIRALPGAAELVRALDEAGHAQAIASSAPRENLRVILDELGLRERFGAVVSGDDITRGKPDPEIFARAAAELGFGAQDCVVLEDAVVGVQAGKSAGMRVYAVTSTRRREELAEADRVVDTLEELGPGDFTLP